MRSCCLVEEELGFVLADRLCKGFADLMLTARVSCKVALGIVSDTVENNVPEIKFSILWIVSG